ncbi:MAG: hypothetical protein K8E66_11630, partial [Phycisphaerales bacterium]|nr:hypothetical protein [Phycisphaerales bacterium]
MRCDRCGQHEATHHDLVVKGGDVRETHLCEGCAQEIGATTQPAGSVSEWLAQFVLSPPAAKPSEQATSLRCDECGLTFSQFKKSGLMGCAACYEAFEQRLTPLLERAHEGAGQHCGKVPRRALSNSRMQDEPEPATIGDALTLAERIQTLRRELA